MLLGPRAHSTAKPDNRCCSPVDPCQHGTDWIIRRRAPVISASPLRRVRLVVRVPPWNGCVGRLPRPWPDP
eukprot:500346-Prymnesium_polylepis.2